MKRVNCTEARHAQQILDIFNEAIINSTALYDYQPRPLASMTTWFAQKKIHNFPVIGYENQQGELLGFATYGTFRDRPAYKYSVEHSIYIHQDHRGKGLGKRLLQQLIETAQAQEMHTLVAGIDAENRASIVLHETLGFHHAGTIRQAAFKFGRWLDLVFYQLILDTPHHPTEASFTPTS
ncbi:phosphinothricin acetyltransferase|uniref:Phosphinothricin acetyltransferase n=1 Tax=Brenneria salicis ATCC 15712 = DSM 30166 TaxID=714314 RepID=A0A366I6G4_9GAMM|nr:GNAT family N-acetyltransferase [Brenneria salicis]NMN92675.1 phosphinothricin acetyltransferase [Brenneria salicis ATCC 15712 = DSM 30166]RBP62490.1 phosphinothricin acetyltransferase [Brenneria salicis ATCC 15712 = DSM 30166]RLM30586.1 GNAT family N-acetyltransferase [Brenneria salicis ATCC 15712 = DSM 30166]